MASENITVYDIARFPQVELVKNATDFSLEPDEGKNPVRILRKPLPLTADFNAAAMCIATHLNLRSFFIPTCSRKSMKDIGRSDIETILRSMKSNSRKYSQGTKEALEIIYDDMHINVSVGETFSPKLTVVYSATDAKTETDFHMDLHMGTGARYRLLRSYNHSATLFIELHDVIKRDGQFSFDEISGATQYQPQLGDISVHMFSNVKDKTSYDVEWEKSLKGHVHRSPYKPKSDVPRLLFVCDF